MDIKKTIIGAIIILVGIAEFVFAFITKKVDLIINIGFTAFFVIGGAKVIYDGIKGK